MSNMSYCRFQNTSLDLRDCLESLMGMSDGSEGGLSSDELEAAKVLAFTCLEIVALLAESAGVPIDEMVDDDALAKEIESISNYAKENEDGMEPR